MRPMIWWRSAGLERRRRCWKGFCSLEGQSPEAALRSAGPWVTRSEQDREMLSRDENDLLTQTNAGTPAGEYFRRFWLPVLLPAEVPTPDSPPVRVKVLGEDLLAFRDTNGRVG